MGIFTRTDGFGEGVWLQRLRHALDHALFEVHLQPVVALADGRVHAHEALLRLADEPDGSLVLPGRFLAHAERSGLICEIDLMVLERVLELLAAPSSAGPEPGTAVAINLSAVSLCDPALLGRVRAALLRHRVDPALLALELTETARIADMRLARSFCAGALQLGCAVALDDFGSGYGSFQYLKHLPFSHLKIDGEFVRGLADSRTDQLVVQALAGIAREMGRATIAECVEDARALQLLRRFGIDYAQGFAVGRPRPMLALVA